MYTMRTLNTEFLSLDEMTVAIQSNDIDEKWIYLMGIFQWFLLKSQSHFVGSFPKCIVTFKDGKHKIANNSPFWCYERTHTHWKVSFKQICTYIEYELSAAYDLWNYHRIMLALFAEKHKHGLYRVKNMVNPIKNEIMVARAEEECKRRCGNETKI